ncbi:MAG: YeaH/YhbH family protein [Paracoccaceae bacterium]
MTDFVDRRLNPKDRNLSNRRRFIARVRDEAKRAVDQAVRERRIADVDRQGSVSVPQGSIDEPHFRHADQGGRREHVLPGNRRFTEGDRLRKPQTGRGGGGKRGSADGEGEDAFAFVLSRDEFLDLFFEDLELPDLVKTDLREKGATKPYRAGISTSGVPANLDVRRTMRHALGRRLALGRPKGDALSALKERLFTLEAIAEPSEAERAERAAIEAEVERLSARQRSIPWLDPLDVRYSYYEQRPEPNAKAVMFCLMDVSASMRERDKDLAKRFFVLLHLFLRRRYDAVDLVFIRHTNRASEVDEDTFFHARDTGGTVVSTALAEMRRIVAERYAPSEWNIYAAQASDGENFRGDSAQCTAMLHETLMPVCQYYAYVEILAEQERHFIRGSGTGSELWLAYREVAEAWPNFAMTRVGDPADIYPVFRELFSRDREGATA